MASTLEALPNEILDSILEYLIDHDIGALRESDHLDCTSLSRLSQCSRSLNSRLESLLYGTVDARNAALRNGCMTGNLHAIRKASSCGVNPGVVRREIHIVNNKTVVDAEQETSYREVSSLQIALKAGQFEAYKLLLALGAGLLTPHDYSDTNMLNSQLQVFAQRLAEPKNEAFLRAFVEARAETPYWKDSAEDKPNHSQRESQSESQSQAQAVVSRLPFPHVVSWASPALLETLLDNGALLNQIAQDKKKRPLTPLGAACLRGDMDVFNLLVARGAHVDIEDSLRSKYPTKYTHIPVFLAAQYMANTGNTNMLDACIAGGADVNRPCHIQVTRDEDENTQPHPPHVCTTPLLTYLGSIKSWVMNTGTDKQHRTTSEGVAHFIHVLGACVPSPVAPPVKRKYCNSDQELHDRTFGGIDSPVELLLAKWGIKSLAIPEFFSVIKLLVKHGGTGPDLARILVRFEGQNEEEPSKGNDNMNMVDLETLWKQFLALLLPQVEALGHNSKNTLLRRVMVDKAYMRHRVAHPSRWVKVRAIGQASISFLVRAGADINAVGVADTDASTMNTRTPLHQLISNFVHTDSLTDSYLHDHAKGYDCWYTRDAAKSFGDFLAFLVNEGADPLIEGTAEYRGDEKTAIDTLLSPIKEGKIEHEEGTVEHGLMVLVARLQGVSQAVDYTGDRKPYRNPLWKICGLSHFYSQDFCSENGKNCLDFF